MFVIVLLSIQTFSILGQSADYAPLERCAGLPVQAPSGFDGVLVTVGGDATRAFREGIATTYVLSFSNGNFLAAGAVSPDGKYYAVPNGLISTITTNDVRYTVQEIRILTTETVPRIVRRLPWRASFPVGTRFAANGDIPPIRWLDSETIQFIDGVMSEGQTPVTINVFEGAPEPFADFPTLFTSPDGARGMTLINTDMALLDTLTGAELALFPRISADILQIAWSPDSESFAMTGLLPDGGILLGHYSRDGELIAQITALPAEQVLWNLRWSPDGAKIAFTAFDPQSIENRLHTVDLAARTVTDHCLPLIADVSGNPLSVLAWSPDGTRLAVMTRQAAPTAQVQIFEVASRDRYNLTAAAGRLLGWYP